MPNISAEQEEQIAALYRSGWSIKRLMCHFHRGNVVIYEILRRQKVKLRTFKRSEIPNYVPTPKEIAEATATIRGDWDDREYHMRAGESVDPIEFSPLDFGPRRNGRFNFGV